MKTQMRTLLSLCLVCLYSLVLTGCGEQDTTEFRRSTTRPPVAEEEHDHEHGPNGYPIVEMSDGSKVECGFDEESSLFTVIPSKTGDVEKVEVKTVTDGEEKVYEFKLENNPELVHWFFEDKELGTAMLMGDAIERTLVITLKDGAGELTAPVESMGH